MTTQTWQGKPHVQEENVKYNVKVFRGYLDSNTSLKYEEYVDVVDYVVSGGKIVIRREGVEFTLGLTTGYEIIAYEQNA